MPERRLISRVCVLLVALPWFWPFMVPPRPEFWTDMVAWSAGAVLLSLLPRIRPDSAWVIATGWLVAALGSAVLGLLQYLDLENGLHPWVARTGPGHALANVHQTNMLATLLAVGLLCVWWMAVQRRLRPWALAGMAALLLAALAATASRTGMLHLLVIAVVLLGWHGCANRTVWRVLLAAMAVYLFSAWALQWLGSLTSGAEIERDISSRIGLESDCHSRFVLWSNVLELIALQPWTGWGPGGLLYAHYITLFDGLRNCAKLSNAHNLPLQMAVTLGVPLTLLIGGGFAWFIARLRPWAATDAFERLAWAALLLIGVHSLLEFPLWYGVFQLMAGLAVWQLLWIRRGQASALGGAMGSVRATTAASVLALVGLAAIGWDYVKVSQIFLPDRQRLASFRTDTYAKARTAWLFDAHVRMADVLRTPMTRENAPALLQGALEALHLAPDAPVIRRVIEAAEMAGQPELAEFHRLRFQAAWPQEYAKWQALRAPQSGRSSPPASPASAPR